MSRLIFTQIFVIWYTILTCYLNFIILIHLSPIVSIKLLAYWGAYLLQITKVCLIRYFTINKDLFVNISNIEHKELSK